MIFLSKSRENYCYKGDFLLDLDEERGEKWKKEEK